MIQKLKDRFVQLSWKILEAKHAYYILSAPIMSDYDYDTLEKQYEALAKQLNETPSASDMVDFDESRHSCRNVAHKTLKTKSWKNYIKELKAQFEIKGIK